MIQAPRRSVTRFFIPMIDVLTVLFCMFLLMPIIQENATLSEDAGDLAAANELKKEIASRQQELQELYQDEKRARTTLTELAEKKRSLVQQSIFIRLLYVSPKDGTLHYFEPLDLKQAPLAIDNANAAAALIARHKKEAGNRELLYIFQEPREASGRVAPYPTYAQEKRYANWFSTVNYDGCVKPPPGKEAK